MEAVETMGLPSRKYDVVRLDEGWQVKPEEVGETGELPVYVHPTIEGVEGTSAELDAVEDTLFWARGALADAISRYSTYGDKGLISFAGRTGHAYSTVLDWLNVYRRVAALGLEHRQRALLLNLRYSHYRGAAILKDDTEFVTLLERASDENWLTGQTAEYARELEARRREHESKPTPEPPEGEPAAEGETPYPVKPLPSITEWPDNWLDPTAKGEVTDQGEVICPSCGYHIAPNETGAAG